MRIAAALTLWFAACAPITTRVVPRDQAVRQQTIAGPVVDVAWRGSVQPSEDGFRVALSGKRTCRAITVRTVRRTDHIQRSADGAVQGITYVSAALLGALGGFLYYDNRSGVIAGDRLWDGSFSPAAGRATGISVGAMGVVALTVGIIDSIRARDGKRAPRELELRDEGRTASMACGHADAGAVQISAAAEGQPAPIPLGTTDAHGQLAVPWSALPDSILGGSGWAKSIRINARAGKSWISLGSVATEAGRRARARQAWKDAETANSPEAYERVASSFPERRGDEAEVRGRKLRVQRVRKALDSGDLTAARRELDELREHHAGAAEIAPFDQELTAAEAAAAAAEGWRHAEQSVAVAEAANADPQAFADATADIATASQAAADPDRESALSARVAQARKARIEAAIAGNRRAPQDRRLGRGAHRAGHRQHPGPERPPGAPIDRRHRPPRGPRPAKAGTRAGARRQARRGDR